jgi:hypothetical protein
MEPSLMEPAMGVLMVRCPVSGREFSSGIQIEEESLERLPDSPVKSRCPACGKEHTWSTRDARFAEAVPPSQWVEAFDRPQ